MNGMIDARLLRELLSYQPDTGKLFWLPRGAEWFNCTPRMLPAMMVSWNGKYAGALALNLLDLHGYFTGTLLRVKVRAHRVAWALHYGAWPLDQVDHINGARDDNRIANLRIVSNAENSLNRTISNTNKSGQSGVGQRADSTRWWATINADKKPKYLGSFANREEAIRARQQAEVEYGYHPNHGKPRLFAPTPTR